MAELVLKILDGAGYEDGDVLCAFNARRIRCVHAEHICFAHSPGGRLIGMDGNGIMPDGHLSRDFQEAVCEYRFERLSRNEGRVVRLADAAEIRFRSNEPFTQFDGRIVAMDIELFVRGKRQAQQFPVHGKYGREIWYGGREDRSDAKLLKVWDRIEHKAGRRHDEPKFKFWPAGQQELKSHLFVPIGDIDDDEAERVVASIVDESDLENPKTLKKRAIKADNWRSIVARLGTTKADVLDRGKSVDKRRDVQPLNERSLLKDKRTEKPVPPKGKA